MSEITGKAIEVSESALRELESNPSLRDLLSKAGVEMTEAGSARITAATPEAAARLEAAAKAVGLSPPSGKAAPEMVDAAKFQTTGGPVPPSRALSTDVRSGVTLGRPVNPDDAFHAGDPRWGDGRPASGPGRGLDAPDSRVATAPPVLPPGVREAYVNSLQLTRPELRRGLAEQLKYAEKMKGAPLTPDEMAAEARSYTTSAGRGQYSPRAAAAPSQSESLSSDFDASLERGLGYAPPTKESSSLGKVLGIGAAGLGATGYALSRSGGEEFPARAAAPTIPTAPGGGTPSSIKNAASASPATSEPTKNKEQAPREVPHVGAVRVTAAKIAKDPNYLGDVISDLDKGVEEAKKQKTEWTAADDERWANQKVMLRNIAREAQNRNDWSEVAEKLAHAVTQMGAAIAGLYSGVDMSGLKFDKTDWVARNKQITDNLRQDLDIVGDNATASRKTVSTAREALDKLMERRRAAAEKRADYERSVGEKNVGFENEARAATGRNAQSAAESDARLQNEEFDRQSREQQTEDRIDAEATRRAANSPAAKAQLAAAKREADEAAKRYTAFGKAAGILAAVKDDHDALQKKMAEIGAQAGAAGIGTEWNDIVNAAEQRNTWWDGKSKEEHILDILKEKQPEFLRMRDAAARKYEDAAAGLGGGAEQPPAAPAPTGPEAGVRAVMQANGITRDQAIDALKKAGKLPADYK